MDELLDYVDERVQPTVGQLRQHGAVVHESRKLSHTNKQNRSQQLPTKMDCISFPTQVRL